MNQKPPISYPAQFAMLLGLLGLFIVITGIIVAILGSVMLNIPLMQVPEAMNKPENGDAARLLNTISSFFAFFLPALIVARVVSKRPFPHLGFNTVMSVRQVLLVVVITFGAMILGGAMGELNERIPLPADLYAKVKKLEETYKAAMMAMASMHSFSEYLLTLLVIAAFPAVFEEVLFRGGFQQILVGLTKNKWAGIILTSILFSAIHFSYFGFLPRVALGMVLGLVFHTSRNLWLNILLHFLNNAFVVTQLYIITRQGKSIEKALDESMPIWWGIIGIVLLVLIFYFFTRESNALLAKKEKETLPSPENMLS
jgi:membrane protease YdiL (CAAX protease family)